MKVGKLIEILNKLPLDAVVNVRHVNSGEHEPVTNVSCWHGCAVYLESEVVENPDPVVITYELPKLENDFDDAI